LRCALHGRGCFHRFRSLGRPPQFSFFLGRFSFEFLTPMGPPRLPCCLPFCPLALTLWKRLGPWPAPPAHVPPGQPNPLPPWVKAEPLGHRQSASKTLDPRGDTLVRDFSRSSPFLCRISWMDRVVNPPFSPFVPPLGRKVFIRCLAQFPPPIGKTLLFLFVLLLAIARNRSEPHQTFPLPHPPPFADPFPPDQIFHKSCEDFFPSTPPRLSCSGHFLYLCPL